MLWAAQFCWQAKAPDSDLHAANRLGSWALLYCVLLCSAGRVELGITQKHSNWVRMLRLIRPGMIC